MRRAASAGVTLLVVALAAACGEDAAPGNDREAQLDAPAPASPMASPEAALANVSPGLLIPEIMTAADQQASGAATGCAFRFTDVGFPAFLYSEVGAGQGVLKVNGMLVTLPASGPGKYSGGGLEVDFRALEQARDAGEPFEAELVVRFPGLPHERGYHGFAGC